MSATTLNSTPAPAKSQFDYLPVGLFGAVMGLTGLSVAWRLAHARYGVPIWAADGVAIAAAAAFVLVTLGYLAKLATAPAAVLAEFRHRLPTTCSARSQSACYYCRSCWHPTTSWPHKPCGASARSAWWCSPG